MTKEEKDLRAKYRMLFLSSTMGQDVLGDILSMCHLGEVLDWENPGMVAEYNVGVAILMKLGTFSEGTLPSVVRALAGVIPKEPPEDDIPDNNFIVDRG